METCIYLDNAATTRVRPEVFEKMKPYFMDIYSNPNSVYRFAGRSRNAVEDAREGIANILGARTDEIYFTGSGSESDNWAIKETARRYRDKGNHIITTKIEHHAVLHACRFLENEGYDVTYLDVDEEGRISLQELEEAIRPATILISIMFANNEIGTIQPIAQVGRVAREHGVLFHTDAVQAFGHMPINVEDMGIDMLSASGHKFHGPKGVGFLYMKNGCKLGSMIHGGAQERKRRGGTLNVPGIVGMGEAARLAVHHLDERQEKVRVMRDYLMERIATEIPYVRVNGHRADRLANNVNVSFRFVEGESLLIMLDQLGICASSGSACTSGSLDPSHVLLAIGLPHEIAHGSLRMTLSEENTMEEMDIVVDSLKKIVGRLRDMSPLYEDFVRSKQGQED